jgi:hypothetical protein
MAPKPSISTFDLTKIGPPALSLQALRDCCAAMGRGVFVP